MLNRQVIELVEKQVYELANEVIFPVCNFPQDYFIYNVLTETIGTFCHYDMALEDRVVDLVIKKYDLKNNSINRTPIDAFTPLACVALHIMKDNKDA